MQDESFSSDLLLFDITIRALAIVATVLFSLLFFSGAEASKKTDAMASTWHQEKTEIVAYKR